MCGKAKPAPGFLLAGHNGQRLSLYGGIAVKAQASLEYLLVLAIALAALAISLSVLYDAKIRFERQARASVAQAAAESIAGAANQICLLGGSNSRTVEGLPNLFWLGFEQKDATVEGIGIGRGQRGGKGSLSLGFSDAKATMLVACGVELTGQEYSNSVYLKGSGGKVFIEQAKEE